MDKASSAPMVIAKYQPITREIRSLRKDDQGKKWIITFRNGQTFRYNECNVAILKDSVNLDPASHAIIYRGKEETTVETLREFDFEGTAFYRVTFPNGFVLESSFPDMEVRESCLVGKRSRNCFDYLREIASLSEIRNEEGEKLLQKYYEKITYLDKDTVLADYLDPSSRPGKGKLSKALIFPFGSNKSQIEAVRNALTNKISLIEGPPGTGKTQTILNIIANLVLQGKSVLVVSNNNSATDNVYEKLEKNGLSFIAAPLGRATNKRAFLASQTGTYPDLSEYRDVTSVSPADMASRLSALEHAYSLEEKRSRLREELSQVEAEHRHFKTSLLKGEDMSEKVKRKLTAAEAMKLSVKLKKKAEKKSFLPFLNRLYLGPIRGFGTMRYWKQEIATILSQLDDLWYQKRTEELKNDISALEEELETGQAKLREREMIKISLEALKHALFQRYDKPERSIFSDTQLWQNPQAFLREYPVVLSTTFSARTTLSPRAHFDYLIMDEASQIDIATGALALSSARNAVIVGDSKQLSNIVTSEEKEKSDAIFRKYDLNSRYDFAANSFLDSVKGLFPDSPATLLREHYRCHPQIIGFCNREFYGGQLIAMTEDQGEKDVLSAIRTVPGMHARNHLNQREIDSIREEVIPHIPGPLEEVGIISPYNAQIRAIAAAFPAAEASTVHKFQGREKNTIILTTTDSEITSFSDDPNLINVAVSRAKDRFVLVTNGNPIPPGSCIGDLLDYIEYHSFTVRESKLRSVFDYLYDAYEKEKEKYLRNTRRVSEFDSENLMATLLGEILSEEGWDKLGFVCHHALWPLIGNASLLTPRETIYAKNPNTHLDFLLYNKVSKRPVLAIEVDGWNYHKAGSRQGERDAKKDSILAKCGLPLLRLKTNGSGEKALIATKLKALQNHQ